MTKVIREYLAELERLGYVVVRTEVKRHVRLLVATPLGTHAVFTVGGTPSDVRGMRNFRSLARRRLR